LRTPVETSAIGDDSFNRRATVIDLIVVET